MTTTFDNPQFAFFKVPEPYNEPLRSYAVGSDERKQLTAAFDELVEKIKNGPIQIPCIVDGKEILASKDSTVDPQIIPSDKAKTLAKPVHADKDIVNAAIAGALKAKKAWEAVPWPHRASIFLKAAELISGKYRYKLLAATMLGQGKNMWQAEIDAAAELSDFLRFGVKYVEEMYSIQPPKNSPGCWNRTEYRPLEGFVYAVSPFNFTAIGGNLVATPAIVGNVCLWKPSPKAIYSNYIVYKIFEEAGLPAGVIQFIPGNADTVTNAVLASEHFAALHFTGSTKIFKSLWARVATNLDNYKSFPRLVGETGGKNFHFIHPSAEVKNAVHQTVRAAFEYQGQKCSACSRLYVPKSWWTEGAEFRVKLAKAVSAIGMGKTASLNTDMLGPVIGKDAFEKITNVIKQIPSAQIVAGGKYDDSVGYYISATIITASEAKEFTMTDEIFGPVLAVWPYEDDKWEDVLDTIDSTSPYGLTGSIFAQDRAILARASHVLRNAAGNVYYNEKCTGAVVGQQPFGGARASGTNDKAGSMGIFWRFVSIRSIKDNYVSLTDFSYPSNVVG